MIIFHQIIQILYTYLNVCFNKIKYYLCDIKQQIRGHFQPTVTLTGRGPVVSCAGVVLIC